jgi:hypothetical protein
MSDKSNAVKTLVKKTHSTPQLERISTENLKDAQEKAKKPIRNYTRDCSLLYTFCAPNKETIDSNCIGDYEKASGCHIFIELGLIAPPKTNSFYHINWERDVVEQLRKIKKAYQTLENDCITQEKVIRTAIKRYEQAEKKFQIFKNEFGPKP